MKNKAGYNSPEISYICGLNGDYACIAKNIENCYARLKGKIYFLLHLNAKLNTGIYKLNIFPIFSNLKV